MNTNVITRIPKIGDAVVGELATGKVKFITSESFSLASLDASAYETIGVVYARNGRKVKIAYKENASKVWSTKYIHTLTGYTLDGTQRSGTISFRASSSASANTDVVVNYSATTRQALVDTLNASFNGNADMKAQAWVAYIENDEVKISYNYTFWQQSSYNSAKDGFTLTASLMPDVDAHANIRRKHGGAGGDGVIASWERALYYYRSSTSADTYAGNVPSDLANAKDRAYPINLTSYLGKSADGQDHCAAIRAIYGEGEEGWLRCMAAYMPVKPCDFGNMGIRNGLELTKKIVSYKDHEGNPLSPAAAYCHEKGTVCLPVGNFYLPTVEDLADLLSVIKYGTNSDRHSDVVNSTLAKMGAYAISNGSYLWSCCRSSAGNAWISSGYVGYFNGNILYDSFLAVPVSLYLLED